MNDGLVAERPRWRTKTVGRKVGERELALK